MPGFPPIIARGAAHLAGGGALGRVVLADRLFSPRGDPKPRRRRPCASQPTGRSAPNTIHRRT